MSNRLLDTNGLRELLDSLVEPGALIELAVLAGCLGLAWAVVRLIRGPHSPEGSIWFGRRVVDGVLFPILALGLAYTAELALAATLKVAV